MKKCLRLILYFGLWILIFIFSLVLNFLNIDWSRSNVASGTFLIIILSLLQGSVIEFPVQTIFFLVFGGHIRERQSGDGKHFKIIVNYNLLAESKDDIDECMQNMFDSYMGNLRNNVSAVLVSATNDEELKHYEFFVRDSYRSLIFNKLHREGIAYLDGNFLELDHLRTEHIWKNYKPTESEMEEFRTLELYRICHNFADNFMVINRKTKVLRKCGQYQDLMLLSEGETEAFTYCDPEYYTTAARQYGDQMFQPSDDVRRIVGKKFDYTLVLDSDNKVPQGVVFELLDVAAAHPDRGIIQPGIILECNKFDTLFMHLESMRQMIYEPLTNSTAAVLEQSSFFGKGLINNKLYIDRIIGSRENLIERVPIDVISHDTFEASIMHPLYVGNIQLTEEPSYNFVTWNIRERRWNKGEILLSMYFFPNMFGKSMRFLQKKCQRKFAETKLRTVSKLDFVSSYVAHSAFRQMFMKPLLLIFMLVHLFAEFKYPYASISVVMFCVVVFPKFATCNRRNYKYVFLETVASMLQFTPEAVVGSVRIFRGFQAIISNNTHWIPQKVVEKEFQILNPYISSFHHLWGYSLVSGIAVVVVFIFIGKRYFFLFMMTTVFLLPIFTAVTSRPSWFSARFQQTPDDNVSTPLSSIRSNLSTDTLIPNSVESFATKNRILAFKTRFHTLSPKDLLTDLTNKLSFA